VRRYREMLAVCVEGVLLDARDTVSYDDARAIDALRARGVAVALVSARMPRALRPIANGIGVDVPLVCGNGAFVVEPEHGAVLGRRTLSQPASASGTALVRDAHLTPFAVTGRSIHGDPRDAGLARAALGEAATHELEWIAAPPPRRDVCFLLGVGAPADVAAVAARWSEHGVASAEAVPHRVALDLHAIRIVPRTQSRARALAAIAARIGVEPRRCANLGARCEPYDDRSAFGWAGTAFCAGPLHPDLEGIATPLPDHPEGGSVRAITARWP
jgi:hydroxymethylpyrimidine pyrophosphatase-like HAD family hydrolase